VRLRATLGGIQARAVSRHRCGHLLSRATRTSSE
jgi:hypothetical protein